jgi:hypothetical protein
MECLWDLTSDNGDEMDLLRNPTKKSLEYSSQTLPSYIPIIIPMIFP